MLCFVEAVDVGRPFGCMCPHPGCGEVYDQISAMKMHYNLHQHEDMLAREKREEQEYEEFCLNCFLDVHIITSSNSIPSQHISIKNVNDIYDFLAKL